MFGSESYERKGLPLYFLLFIIPYYKTQKISKKLGGRGVRSILATPKYTLKSAFLVVFYKCALFCQLLTTYISMTVQNVSKILFVYSFQKILDVFMYFNSIFNWFENFGFWGPNKVLTAHSPLQCCEKLI